MIEEQGTKKTSVRLIFGTGGIRVISGIGILKELTRPESHFEVRSVAGCSAGALIAALAASHKPLDEIERFILQSNWQHLAGKRTWPWEKLFGPCAKYKRAGFADAVGSFLDNPTFDDLRLPLEISVVDLHSMDIVRYPHDDPLGSKMRVADALRQSISVPSLFPLAEARGRLFVDGAFSSQLHLALLPRVSDEQIAFVVTCHVQKANRVPRRVDHLLARTVEVSIALNDKFVLSNLGNLAQLHGDQLPWPQWIEVVSQDIGFDQFNLSTSQKQNLISAGAQAMRGRLSDIGILDERGRIALLAILSKREGINMDLRKQELNIKDSTIHGSVQQGGDGSAQFSIHAVDGKPFVDTFTALKELAGTYEDAEREQAIAAIQTLEAEHANPGTTTPAALAESVTVIASESNGRELLKDLSVRAAGGALGSGIVAAIKYVIENWSHS